jgi:hypothetical protein
MFGFGREGVCCVVDSVLISNIAILVIISEGQPSSHEVGQDPKSDQCIRILMFGCCCSSNEKGWARSV